MRPPPHAVLAGLKVLDLTRLLPGPYCSLILADLGATVIKIEDPKGGDYLRLMPPLWPNDEATLVSAAFCALNRNKQSVAINLKHPEGVGLLRRLCGEADVLIESFRPGVMAKLGISAEALRAEHPRLVVASISGYGQNGPLRERAGHDLNYVARAGALSQNAAAGAPPHPLSVQVADLAAGALFPAVAILAALLGREKSGEGAHIDAAMCEGSAALMPFAFSGVQATGLAAAAGDDLLTGGVPCYGVYPTQDGKYLAVAALEPKFWRALCEALDREDLAGGGLLTGSDGQRVRRELAAIFARKPRAEWQAFFADLDCCVEPVLTVDELSNDSQHQARGLFVTVEQNGRAMTQVRTPIVFAHHSAPPVQPAPALGEQTDAVLRALGVPAHEIAQLRARGTVA